MSKIIELRNRRFGLTEANRRLLQDAEDGNRDLTDAEEETFDARTVDIKKVDLEIAQEQQRARAEQLSRIGSQEYDNRPVDADYVEGDHKPEFKTGQWFDNETGKPLEVVPAGQPWGGRRSHDLVNGVRAEDLSLARLVRGTITGDWKHALAERRALDSITPSAGGYLLPSPLSDSIIDAARNQLQVQRAGANMVKLERNSLRIATVESEPTAAWTAENQELTEADMTFGSVEFKMRKVGCYMRVSEELIRGAANLEDRILSSFGFAIAKAIDLACLTGTGSAEQPMGIKSTPGIQSTDLAGAANVALDDLATAYYAIASVNGSEQVSAIYNSDMAKSLAKLKDGEGRYLLGSNGNAPDFMKNISRYVTNQITTDGSNQTDLYVGDFRQLYIGVQDNVIIDSSRYVSEGFKRAQLWLRCFMFLDVAVIRANNFYVIKNGLVS